MDLIVLKPQEVQTRLQGGDLVLREILTKGEVLFEAVTQEWKDEEYDH